MVLGFGLGALLLAAKGMADPGPFIKVLPAHVHLLVVGWVLQLAMGVAYSILPRRRGSRGAPAAAWLVWLALNGGVALAAGGSYLNVFPALAIGRGSEAAAAVVFAALIWPRARSAQGQ